MVLGAVPPYHKQELRPAWKVGDDFGRVANFHIRGDAVAIQKIGGLAAGVQHAALWQFDLANLRIYHELSLECGQRLGQINRTIIKRAARNCAGNHAGCL